MNVRLSQKGWVVIPAILRRKYGLKPGANIQIVDYGGVLALAPVFKDPITEGAGLLKEAGNKQPHGSLTEAIVEEHRKERERESR
jgi:bifunctional DNA-binding transcriptional regulator/antitoxin component of YhaV-PrlF toxin-antitoxin module